MINRKHDIIQLIKEDEWMMNVLKATKSIHLSDWWVCAGFVRSKIWDTLHGFTQRTEMPDVDVIYFDNNNLDKAEEIKWEKKLRKIFPGIPWSVKNQARMHIVHNIPAYLSSVDAISKFPETATSLGLTLDEEEHVILTAPCGIEDVINLKVKPTAYFAETEDRMEIYKERINRKNWQTIWDKIVVYHSLDEQ